jgi:hypothetical protein
MFPLRCRPRPVRLTLEPLEPRDVPGFLAPVNYAVGNDPQDVAVADVNGDGRADAVVAIAGAGKVAVLMGKGDGTFQAPVFYRTGTVPEGPDGVRVGDLNGDGKPDIVTANFDGGNVSIFLNRGDGTFQRPHTFGTNLGYLYKVAIGDVDGDHIPDVAASDYNGGNVWVFHGHGDGTLGLPLNHAVHFASQSVQITDLDGDGVGDVSVDSAIGFIDVWYGNGVGTSYQAGDCWGHAAADVNGDGRPDLVAGRWNSNNVTVLLNRGGGAFKPATDFPTGQHPYFPVAADFNRDNKVDIAATLNSSVGILLGNGDGTFQGPLTYPAGGGAIVAAVGDMNQDGYPDLVVANSGDGTVSVLLNDGNWTAPMPPPGPGRSPEPPAALPADAGCSANPLPGPVRLENDSVAAPPKAGPAPVTSPSRRVPAGLGTSETFRVLQGPFA